MGIAARIQSSRKVGWSPRFWLVAAGLTLGALVGCTQSTNDNPRLSDSTAGDHTVTTYARSDSSNTRSTASSSREDAVQTSATTVDEKSNAVASGPSTDPASVSNSTMTTGPTDDAVVATTTVNSTQLEATSANATESSRATSTSTATSASLTGASSSSVSAKLSKDQTVRVMPFGDSITATGCWRERFLSKVSSGGFIVDMVGSTKEKQCNETDVDNEGHSGKLITMEQNNVSGWAQANPADVVLFHWGTNDVWKSAPISDDYVNEILAAYSTAVAGLRDGNPNVIVVVAQIIALNPSDGGCAACPGNVEKLNASIPAWAITQGTIDSPVLVADLWTDFDPAVHTQDGAHPYTEAGVEHMASRWYAAFAALFE